MATTISCPLVYNQNHYFGLGTIPRPKPKLADTFSRYRNRYKNHILKGQSSYVEIATGIFSIIKGPQTLDTFRLFLKIWVYFQAYKSLYPPKKREKMRKLWSLKKSFGLERKTWLRYRYRNWSLVLVLDTETWFYSHTNVHRSLWLGHVFSSWTTSDIIHFCFVVLVIYAFGSTPLSTHYWHSICLDIFMISFDPSPYRSEDLFVIATTI